MSNNNQQVYCSQNKLKNPHVASKNLYKYIFVKPEFNLIQNRQGSLKHIVGCSMTFAMVLTYMGPDKWIVTVSRKLQFMKSYLES